VVKFLLLLFLLLLLLRQLAGRQQSLPLAAAAVQLHSPQPIDYTFSSKRGMREGSNSQTTLLTTGPP
jgi:hypothetical protein